MKGKMDLHIPSGLRRGRGDKHVCWIEPWQASGSRTRLP